MIVFPNCKINLGLRVVRKRDDGYHDLQTVFYPLPFIEALELLPATGRSFSFSVSGLPVEKNADNLCVKAYELLKKDFPGLPALQMHLHKSIPTGAGLGGGSADGAFTLQLINRKFSLGLSQQSLIHYALQLGSDCPFFVINKPCFATSRGEVLEEIQTDLSAFRIVLINPGIHIHTGKTFSGIVPAIPAKTIKTIVQQPVESWKEELLNDFEPVVFEQYPEIKAIKETLYRHGAVYASMSGSGSSVYGIFAKEKKSPLSFPSNYLVKYLNS